MTIELTVTGAERISEAFGLYRDFSYGHSTIEEKMGCRAVCSLRDRDWKEVAQGTGFAFGEPTFGEEYYRQLSYARAIKGAVETWMKSRAIVMEVKD